MQHLITSIFFILTFCFLGCQTESRIINLSRDITIEIPGEFKAIDSTESNDVIFFTSTDGASEIICALTPLNREDSLYISELSTFLQQNALSYSKSLNGHSEVINDASIDDLQAKDLHFEYLKEEVLFEVFAQVFIHGERMYMISFETPKPASEQNKQRIMSFFDTIQIL